MKILQFTALCSFPLVLGGIGMAEQSGLFTYRLVEGGSAVEITDYPDTETGHLAIPAEIDGKPVTRIGRYAFEQCSGLTGIDLPAGITTIGDGAFDECSGLTGIDLPAGITAIGASAFETCSGLTAITIPYGITRIDNSTFIYCSGLASVGIPDSVTSIGSSAFARCSNLAGITLPPQLTEIADSAFWSCSGLTKVTIPASTATIGEGAFRNCSGLTAIFVEPGNPGYLAVDGVLFDAAGSELLQYPGARTGPYAIEPGVARVATGAFEGGTGLSTVAVPASVTFIAGNAFASCSGLTSIDVDPGNSIYRSIDGVLYRADPSFLLQFPGGRSGHYAVPTGTLVIGGGSFWNCTRLGGITIPDGVIAIEQGAFKDCTGLGQVTVPGSVAIVHDYAFAGCSSLTRVTLLDGVTRIGPWCFNSCTALADVTIPPTLHTIDDYAFRDCSSLRRLPLPDGLQTIGSGAFMGCSSLEQVLIPATVTHIRSLAFADCGSLVSAVFLGNGPWRIGEFYNASEGFTLYHLSSKTGFEEAPWLGYPAVEIDESVYPAASWLLKQDMWYDLNLQQDLNGDGVSLLMAYALDLDLAAAGANLPRAIMGPTSLNMEFFASAPGVIYTVQTSTDMETWVTDGVTLSDIDPDGRRIATVDRSSPRRFLRLVVAEE